MGTEILANALGPAEWSATASLFRDYNLYQTWAYGELSAARTGGEVHRLAIYQDANPIGLCQACVKRIPLVGGGIAQIYWGPLWRCAEGNAHSFEKVLLGVHQHFAQRLGLNLRLISQIWHERFDEQVVSAFARTGFQEVMPSVGERTICIDLTSPPEQLRANLHQKWRNCLNHAERNGLELRSGTGTDLMEIFVDLYAVMWAEKRFSTGVNIHQMRKLHRALPPNEQLTVQIAMSDGVPAAGHVSFVLGDTCVYLLGASNERGRRLKASYLLQWKTIELAKGRGAQWYDLGGVDREGNPGVYHFKSGMGGREVRYLAPLVAPGRARSRHLVPLAERAYRILRRYRRAG